MAESTHIREGAWSLDGVMMHNHVQLLQNYVKLLRYPVGQQRHTMSARHELHNLLDECWLLNQLQGTSVNRLVLDLHRATSWDWHVVMCTAADCKHRQSGAVTVYECKSRTLQGLRGALRICSPPEELTLDSAV
jgi:hypothetical protein